MPLGGVGEVLELSWPKNSLRKKIINSRDRPGCVLEDTAHSAITTSVHTAEKGGEQPHVWGCEDHWYTH